MPTPPATNAPLPASAAALPASARFVVVGLPESTGPAVAWLRAAGLGDPVAVLMPEDAADAPSLIRKHHATHAILSIPSAMRDLALRLESAARSAGMTVLRLPTAMDAVRGGGVSPPMAPVGDAGGIDPAALIGRAARPLDAAGLGRADRALRGRRVLITGAGGSIGSELARIVASFGPSEIVLMERSENALFEIDRILAARFPRLSRRAMLHDVVEAESTRAWLQKLRPDVVFHAAAHKHVTIMEDHPSHAVNNNFFGTRSIADASLAAGVSRFVMISTDKAVNPTSVMGATKRFAEWYVGSLNREQSSMRACMVRFGNVLASACSVVPIWSRQIAEGGPVTVTHPEMTRYFMTIPEAASLVIQAGSLDAKETGGADVFVLDMGQPIRIVELAERFARLHGLQPRFPDRNDERSKPSASSPAIDVVFTGARPGEKLHEELAHASESLRPTPAPGVLAWAVPPDEASPAKVRELVEAMESVRWSPDRKFVLDVIRGYAPAVGAGESGRPQAETPVIPLTNPAAAA